MVDDHFYVDRCVIDSNSVGKNVIYQNPVLIRVTHHDSGDNCFRLMITVKLDRLTDCVPGHFPGRVGNFHCGNSVEGFLKKVNPF